MAIAIAHRFRRLGRTRPFIARFALPEAARAEPFADASDHLTAYGDPDAFVRSTESVEPIDFSPRNVR